MKRKEFNHNQNDYQKALELSIEIQNKGLGTTFFYHAGHVNRATVDIHVPVWDESSRPAFSVEIFSEKGEDNSEAIKKLQDFLIQEESMIDLVKSNLDKQKGFRKMQYEILKKEFEEAV